MWVHGRLTYQYSFVSYCSLVSGRSSIASTSVHCVTIMPPLSSTIHEETSNLIESLNRRQKDLQEFQIPRLRDFKGSLATQQQYAAELRDDLEHFGKNVQVSIFAVSWNVREYLLSSVVEPWFTSRRPRAGTRATGSCSSRSTIHKLSWPVRFSP